MNEGRPSRTAQRVAVRRAAHQLIDRPLVFEDPFAMRIIGADAAAATEAKAEGKVSSAFRAFMAVRSRYAEDELRSAVERGVRQYVVLGAGLDTFAWRNPWAELRVFEVDFPATQHWKKQRVTNVGMGIPESLTFAPVDFESQTLADGLRAAGFREDQSAYFSWLGVTMYLTLEAFDSTMRFIGSLPPGGGVTFDYAVERSELGILEKVALDHLAKKVASLGEPFQLFFRPKELAERMRRFGFSDIEDMGRDELNARYFANRSDGLRVRGGAGRLMRARHV
ncbi:MAG TPA: class I SAM-dependent methyltransferase [Bryobacteraceae bacterium]|nr:class I SAM-dependent methyltransferase [Bryobacteraceae bacterium]